MSWLVHRTCKACARRFSVRVNATEKIPELCEECRP